MAVEDQPKPPETPIREQAPLDVGENTPFDDARTEKAIDAIVAQEGDELLAVQDAAQVIPEGPRPGFWRRFGRLLAWPWRNKWARYSLLVVFAGAGGAMAAIPAARYYVLDASGVRVSSSVTITDDVTHQPLKNVSVHIGGAEGKTGADGTATFQGLRLGPATLVINRPGFDPYERRVTLGWGSNPLGTIALQSVGLRYTFIIKDFLTNKPIEGAEVAANNTTAISDKQGKAMLVLDANTAAEITADIGRDGYRTETVTARPSNEPKEVALAVTRKAVFVSKERGTYDVYSSDIDGLNRQLLLGGTGHETANISLAVSPDGSRAALVSTRDGKRDNNGGLLSALTLIDIGDGSTVSISHAVQIRLLDWAGTRLVFEQTVEEKGTVKHVITSYDYAPHTRLQLASASRFTSVVSAQGAIYYAVASDSTNASVKPGFYRIGTDGANRQTILEKELWTVYRTGYNTFHMQASDGWYATTIDTGTIDQTEAPATYKSRMYLESPANTGRSLWVDTRDGQGVLHVHNRQDGKDTVIYRQPGVASSVRWVTEDIVVYRMVSNSETADYAVSALGGGVPRKIADVVNTYGFTAGQ